MALRYLRPKRNFVSVITVLSLLGVTLGVGVLIIVLSVMEGFEKELRDKIVSFQAHVTVLNYGIMHDWPAADELLKQQPEVVATTPVVVGPVLARCNGRVSTPRIRGMDVDSSERVNPLKRFITSGELDLRPGAVVVGAGWARINQAAVGDKIVVYSPRNLTRLMQADQAGDGEYYLPSEYAISGIFATGYFEFDTEFVLVSLAEAQRLYDLRDGIHGILVRTNDPLRAFALRDKLNAQLKPPLLAETWMDQNSHLFGAVAVERLVMSFVLFFIIIVAALGLCSTLITVTVQKAREIGLMKALGASDGQIVKIFTFYGLVVGVLGSALGVGFGYLVLHYRNEFLAFLRQTLRLDVFPPEIYHFAQLPAVADPGMTLWIALAGVMLSTAAALLPAFAALRVDPASTLHAE